MTAGHDADLERLESRYATMLARLERANGDLERRLKEAQFDLGLERQLRPPTPVEAGKWIAALQAELDAALRTIGVLQVEHDAEMRRTR